MARAHPSPFSSAPCPWISANISSDTVVQTLLAPALRHRTIVLPSPCSRFSVVLALSAIPERGCCRAPSHATRISPGDADNSEIYLRKKLSCGSLDLNLGSSTCKACLKKADGTPSALMFVTIRHCLESPCGPFPSFQHNFEIKTLSLTCFFLQQGQDASRYIQRRVPAPAASLWARSGWTGATKESRYMRPKGRRRREGKL